MKEHAWQGPLMGLTIGPLKGILVMGPYRGPRIGPIWTPKGTPIWALFYISLHGLFRES